MRLHVVRPCVCPSVTLVDQEWTNQIGWKSWNGKSETTVPYLNGQLLKTLTLTQLHCKHGYDWCTCLWYDI